MLGKGAEQQITILSTSVFDFLKCLHIISVANGCTLHNLHCMHLHDSLSSMYVVSSVSADLLLQLQTGVAELDCILRAMLLHM